MSIATIILAGGQGSRLFPLTRTHPKPSVSFGGRYRLIDVPVSNSINSNMRRIFIIAQHLASELQHHLIQTYQFDAFYPGSLDFLMPEERPNGERVWFNGTADAIRKCFPILHDLSVDYFLILAGDQLYNMDFHEMLRFAQEKDADLTIAALPVPEKEAQRMGVLKIDPDNRITHFFEKPRDPAILQSCSLGDGRELCSMGIYIFKRSALESLLKEDLREDFGQHLIPSAIERYCTYAFLYQGYWEDIGTIQSYYDANLALTHGSFGIDIYNESNPIYTKPCHLPGPKINAKNVFNSIICEGSYVEASEISSSVIGLRSRVGKGSILRGTVLMGNHMYQAPPHLRERYPEWFGVGEDCHLENVIVDQHVQIGNHVTLVNTKKVQEFDGDGIFIRDGIIVVAANTKIPDNFRL